jgi:predicted MFS family arabinose efflux permease
MSLECELAAPAGAGSRFGTAGADAAGGLTRPAVLLFAVACGLSVANIYYAQPLLDAMAVEFGMDPAKIGGIVTITQAGYVAGLLLLVPLGDLVDRRRLILGQMGLSAVALVAVGLAPGAGALLAAMAAVGLLAVVIQVLVAFAATLAVPEGRGAAVGAVTSGVVLGLLLARTVAGAMADLAGWRSVYFASAAATLLVAAALSRVLPARVESGVSASYPQLLRSVFALFVREPVLRARGMIAMLMFAAATTFLTPMVLPLAAPPHSLSHTQIGLFGLAGAAGALGAARAGRLADRGLGQWTTGIGLALMLASWGAIGLTESSLLALALGMVAFDFGLQAVHVTNQGMIFAVRPEARSRLAAGYMVFYSVGSGAGSIASTAIYARAGWIGVSLLGAAISALALASWAATLRSTRGIPGGSGKDLPGSR